MTHAPLPPGPRMPRAVQSVAFWTRPLAFLERCRRQYGRRFTLRLLGAPPFVMLSDPDEIKEVFTAPPDVLHPGEGARVLAPVVGQNSVILLDEDAHMEQRKLMLPAFHGDRIARLQDLVAAVAEREVAGWPEQSITALHPLLQRLTLEVVLRAVFGLDPGPRLDGLRERLSAMLAFGDRFISVIPPEPGTVAWKVAERVGPFTKFLHLQREADDLLFELIDERRRAGQARDDVLAMLLDARHADSSPMTDQELRDELMTLLVAGHETTASALAWAFERLARHPDALAHNRWQCLLRQRGDRARETMPRDLRHMRSEQIDGQFEMREAVTHPAGCPPLGRHRLDVAQQAMEARDSHGRQRPPRQGAGQQESQRDGLPTPGGG